MNDVRINANGSGPTRAGVVMITDLGTPEVVIIAQLMASPS